jgi:putative endonuclease
MRHRPVNPHIALGQAGEDRAASWYAGHGYQIIERNWRSRIGEIDLICARPDVLVFCEVKNRCTDRLGDPVEAVTPGKQLRLRRLASQYILLHTSSASMWRRSSGPPSPSSKMRFESSAA